MTTAVESIRNVAFLGHPSAGKTTLVDALAHMTGASPRKGSVTDRTSICDTEPEEQDRGHTLVLSIVHAEHEGRSWNFIDTPAYPDFMADAEAGTFASDVAVGVVSFSSGVTYNLRTKMKRAVELGKGRLICLTHLDAENADFDAMIAELREKIGVVCVPFQLPDASGHGFSAVRSTLAEEGSDWRKRLMDRVMDACDDEDLLMRYLETQSLSDEELHAQIPVAIARGALVPVFITNPTSGLGVADFLEFLREFAPHPGLYQSVSTAGEPIELDPEGELLAAVFAVRSDPHVGKICFAKVLRGTLHHSDLVCGPHTPERGQKLGGLFHMIGAKREAIDSAKPGDIVAFSKVDTVKYDECITHPGRALVSVAMPAPPTPMVALAVVPKSRADETKIGEALHKLEAEDPGFHAAVDPETHEMVMRGMSDLHLQVMEQRLKRRFGVEIDTYLPRISFQETVTKSAEGHHRHKKQSGGRGQFGECYVRVRPLEEGSGVVFKDAIVGGAIPRNLIPAVEKGIRELAAEGILTHSKVIDVEVELYDGKFHAVDSDEASFKKAGARAFMDGFHKAAPVLLEPVMELVISIPTDAAGVVFSDLTSHRRGHVFDQWTEADGSITVVKAHAPLSTVQTYHRDLKSQTAGEGAYTMTHVRYAQMPAAEQQKVLAAASKQHAAD